MEFIFLIILSIAFGSCPFAEGSLVSACCSASKGYKQFSKDGCNISQAIKKWLPGKKFNSLEILENYGGDGYPNCNSIKAIEFSSADNEANVVRVTLLKLPWNSETAEVDEEKMVIVLYQMMPKKVSFVPDSEKFPNKGTAFGLESLQSYSDPDSQDYCPATIRKVINSLLNIWKTLNDDFKISMVYMPKDKTYAIFRTSNGKCTWIGWRTKEAQTKGLTEEIKGLLTAVNINYRQPQSQNQASTSLQQSETSIISQNGGSNSEIRRIES